MRLIAERTNIPVPRVFGHEFDDQNVTESAFVLMEYLQGDTGSVAAEKVTGTGIRIPTQHQDHFYASVAQVQVCMTSVRLPKIGMVVRNSSGNYDVEPIPDIGGPFETASAFFRAWAESAKFPESEGLLKSIESSPFRDEILDSIKTFPNAISASLSRFIVHDEGPFQISHRDFFHSNIIVDADFKVEGVIDWEGACTLPWELIELPNFLETIPKKMDAPANYNDAGEPKSDEARQLLQNRIDYVHFVIQSEQREETDDLLSSVLANEILQSIAYAVRVYTDPGKLGLYNRILV